MADRLERRLSAELRELASTAQPPADAWERFVRRANASGSSGEDVPGRPTRLVLLDPETGNEIDRHRHATATEFTMETDGTPSRRPGRLLLGAAAALAALTVAGVVVASRDGGDDGSASQQTDADGTRTDVGDGNGSVVDAYMVITGAFEAFNDGALAAWGAEHAASADLYGELALASEERARTLGARYEDVSCTHVGFDEHEFYDDEGPVGPLSGDRFDCSGKLENAFSIAAGVEFPRELVWVVRDGRVVYLSSTGSSWRTLRAFEQGFLQWLSRKHPDVIESRGIEPNPFEIEVNDEDLAVLLPYLDEFVEQSDRWPLDES